MKTTLKTLIIFLFIAVGIRLHAQTPEYPEPTPLPVRTLPIDISPQEDMNWNGMVVYDENGNTISKSTSYYDDMGRLLQSQSKNIVNDDVFATEVKRDVFGREVLSTLPGKRNSGTLQYDASFFPYDYTDFDERNTLNNPNPVDQSAEGTLGYYYSDNNALEPYTPTTLYPYSRVEYHKDPRGFTKRTSGPDALRMGSGHEMQSYQFLSGTELEYLLGRFTTNILEQPDPASPLLEPKRVNEYIVNKGISVGPDGLTSISYIDNEGRLVASCLSGTGEQCQNITTVSNINHIERNYVDIHLPASKRHSLKVIRPVIEYNEQNGDLLIYDLHREEYLEQDVHYTYLETSGIVTIQSHPGEQLFLRITNRLTVEPTTAVITEVKYDLDYTDWSLIYYDVMGRVKKVIPPLGIDCATGTPEVIGEEQYIGSGKTNRDIKLKAYNVNIPSGAPSYDQSYESLMDVSMWLHRDLNVVEEPWGNHGPPADGPGSGPGRDETFTTDVTGKFLLVYHGASGEKQVRDIQLTHTYQITLDEGRVISIQRTDSRITPSVFFCSEVEGFIPERMTLELSFNYEINIQSAFLMEIQTYNVIKSYLESNLEFGMTGEGTFRAKRRPQHTMAEEYEYNADGLVIRATSPDVGLGNVNQSGIDPSFEYLYTKDGRIRFSQNPEQRQRLWNQQMVSFSYTNYDQLGRVVESGECNMPTSANLPFGNGGVLVFHGQYEEEPQYHFVSQSLHIILENLDGLPDEFCSQQSYIEYDKASGDLPSEVSSQYTQHYVRGKISKTWNENAATWYSYDELGRVVWVIRKIEGLGVKTMDYTYDFFGNVETVDYQKYDATDWMQHEYVYDEAKRLKEVYTNFGTEGRQKQAAYFYYAHGPLKRVELAEDLQGIDMVYTINGQLKAINSPSLSQTEDSGHDGAGSGFASDVFGMALDYHHNDYQRSGTTFGYAGPGEGHYNGLITGMRWRTDGQDEMNGLLADEAQVYAYQYDYKHQLTQADFGQNGSLGNTFGSNFQLHNVSYDKNGNFNTLGRNYDGVQNNDAFQYNYMKVNQVLGIPGSGTRTNKLTSITNNGNPFKQYSYDLLGQMTGETQFANGVDEAFSRGVKYDVYGKVIEVVEGGNTLVKFIYDEGGYRVKKETYDPADGTLAWTTFYVHDNAGNVMAVYDDRAEGVIQVTEQPIYGASKLGTLHRGTVDAYTYDMKDHLGNVRATIQRMAELYSNTGIFDLHNTDPEFISSSNTGVIFTPDNLSIFLSDSDDVIEKEIQLEGGTDYRLNVSYRSIGASSIFMEILQNGEVSTTTEFPVHNEPTPDQIAVNFTVLGSGQQAVSIRFKVITSSIGTFMYIDDMELLEKEPPIDLLAYSSYFPFGMKFHDKNTADYRATRHDYQGEFSEKDEETGWNAFQLRMYDARIGRWLSVDPYGEFASPYRTGNNPVSNVDPDGGYEGEFIKYKGQDGDWIIEKVSTVGDDEGFNVVYYGYYKEDGSFASPFSRVEDPNTLKEVNIGGNFSAKLGPFSVNFGPQIAFGSSNRSLTGYHRGFNIAARFIGSVDGKLELAKIFEANTWTGSGFDLSASLGHKKSYKPTVLEETGEFKNKTSMVGEISILGNGVKSETFVNPHGAIETTYSLLVGVKNKVNASYGAQNKTSVTHSTLVTTLDPELR